MKVTLSMPSWRFRFCSRDANAAAPSLAHWSFDVKLIPISCFCDGDFPIVDSFIFPY